MMNGDTAIEVFLEVCQFQRWQQERIQEDKNRTPDYKITTSSGCFIAEVKQLNIEGYRLGQVFSDSPGRKVRQAIGKAMGQLQGRNIPTMLVMYDVHRMGLTRYESMVAGMYGDMTILIDKRTGRSGEMFYGRNSKMRKEKNTSISAIADICYDCSNTSSLKPHIDIYHNMYAKNPFNKDFFIEGEGLFQYWFKEDASAPPRWKKNGTDKLNGSRPAPG